MKVYKQSLGDSGRHLDSTIILLEHTSLLVEIFNDLRPIRGPDDPRITQLHSVLQWFEEWETAAVDKKSFFSYQTAEDVKSMLVGFLNLVQNHFKSTMLPTSIIPVRINSDLIENWFCQQRTLAHAANTNPTARDYGIAVNALVIMQAPMSTKRNAFKQESNAKILKK